MQLSHVRNPFDPPSPLSLSSQSSFILFVAQHPLSRMICLWFYARPVARIPILSPLCIFTSISLSWYLSICEIYVVLTRSLFDICISLKPSFFSPILTNFVMNASFKFPDCCIPSRSTSMLSLKYYHSKTKCKVPFRFLWVKYDEFKMHRSYTENDNCNNDGLTVLID